ncbi:phosphatase PAP2 family protein [Candidatus Saccharibacteria bacterium]|nr:phosphatase PAP2 family protein [Candidatus Saccharibacteria bacterium]
MQKTKKYFLQMLGAAGVATCLILFLINPSFPTPDKILFFLVFVFMIFKQATVMLRRLLPFVAVLLVYESFRGFADELGAQVNFTLAPAADELLFGGLPTTYLQNLLWTGSVSWYDFVFYGAYLLHFILPIALVILIWKTRPKHYWRSVASFTIVAFAAFVTYFLIPAAPPWMAAEQGYIAPITRISSEVWGAFGLQDFPSLYNSISPNPVAAIPSLHAAWATLISIIVLRLYGGRWGLFSAIYPVLIFIGTVYQGEHYVFDVILGVIYAAAGYYLTYYAVNLLQARKTYRRKALRLKTAKAH